MKAICYSGVREINAKFLETINGYDVYKGKLDDNEYCLFMESSNVLWLIGDYKIHYIEHKDKLIEFFSNPFASNIEERELENLKTMIEKAEAGTICRMSNGAAEFFGMTEQVNRAREAYNAMKQAKEEESRIKKEQYEHEQAEKREQAFTRLVDNYKSQKPVGAEDFIWICERYNIAIPLKTHGWLKKVCNSVYASGQYSYNSGKGGKSESIFKLIKLINVAVGYTGLHVAD